MWIGGNLVSSPSSLDLLSFKFLDSGPTLWSLHDDHRPSWFKDRMSFSDKHCQLNSSISITLLQFVFFEFPCKPIPSKRTYLHQYPSYFPQFSLDIHIR